MPTSEILTTVVGSYPTPDWLKAYPSRPHLRDATMVVVRTQELAGIDVVADGELYRFDVNHPETNGMVDYFVRRMSGIETSVTARDTVEFSRDEGLRYRREPAGVVAADIGSGTLDLAKDFESFRHLTDRRTKFTLTGPHMLSKVLMDRHYGNRADVAMAIADVLHEQTKTIDADVIQVDEANIAGHPEDSEWASRAINRVLDGIPGEKAVHLCFGNYGGQTVQQGLYASLAPFMDALRADHLVLEFSRRGYAELDVLRDLRADIGIGLGVVDIKDNEIESPDDIARTIERAERALGPGRVRYVHPDCGFWMLQRSVADGKMRALAQGRDRYLGGRG
ncbi:cobalamin-independent methionine synthase II family protein [Candidatus Poribacteria bacterium]|nr:cobalamin-independent methionine synthase II family protein [Candidatus Poribacteria bacterium]